MITTKVSLENPGVLFLGRRGEKNARQFVFDVNRWAEDLLQDKLDSYHYRLLVLRPREKTPYAAETTLNGEGLVWVPQPADFAKSGEGSIEIQFVSDAGAVLKSALIRTRSEGCIGDSEGPVPEDHPGWYKRVLGAVEDSARAAQSAEQSAGKAAEVSNVFVAEYGKTSFAEVKKAWEEGKAIVCHVSNNYGGYCAGLSYVYLGTSGTTNYFEFVRVETAHSEKKLVTYEVYAWISNPSNSGWSQSTTDLDSTYADKDHTHTPESIGAISALGESISDPETNIDALVLTKNYLCGATVIKNGLKGDLPFPGSFLLKVEDFTGDGRRSKQTALRNNVKNPQQKWRYWNGTAWSAWIDTDGKVAALEERIAVLEERIAALEKREITFKVNSTQYTAPEGMTWAEFVASDYNTKDEYGNPMFKIIGENVYYIFMYGDTDAENGEPYYSWLVGGEGAYQFADMSIIPGAEYYTED